MTDNLSTTTHHRDDLTIAYFTGSAPEPFLPKRFPKAKLALGHLGETLPYQLWRFDSRAKLYGEIGRAHV